MKTPEEYAEAINQENDQGYLDINSPDAHKAVSPDQLRGPLLDAYRAGMTEAAILSASLTAKYLGPETARQLQIIVLAARDAKTTL